jgi:RNA polymerase sigma factor (sigma-70 family)
VTAGCPELDDETLLRAWRSGDRGAGEILIARHYDRIARFFRARRRSDWEELTQSTFLGCIEAIQRFRGEASFTSFIFAIAHKKLLKQIRDQTRSERRSRAIDVESDPADGSSWSRGSASAIHQRLLRTLRAMPVDTQIMLELHYWENQGIRAIAARFGLPEGTIKARLHRGRQQIMAEFAGLEGSPSDFEIMRHALEQWADELNEGAPGEPVKLAANATTRVGGEQPRHHEPPPPLLQTLSHSAHLRRRIRDPRL